MHLLLDSSLNYGSFAKNLAEALYDQGIDTVVSATTGGALLHYPSSGRRVYSTDIYLGYKNRTVQTKDKEYRCIFEKNGYTPTTGLKRHFWFENGQIKSRSI